MTTQPLAFLPSPTTAQINLGPFPIRFYALCIIAGIAIAVWLGERRWRAKGGEPHIVTDIAIWAVPFGLVGGRLYNVITDPELYFPRGQDWVHVFYVWDGGLGIWGAIMLGGLGAWIGAGAFTYWGTPLARPQFERWIPPEWAGPATAAALKRSVPPKGRR